MVPDEPESLISVIEAVDRGGSISEQQKRMLRIFAAWRSAVWRQETEVDSSLRVLLYAADVAIRYDHRDLELPITQHAYEMFGVQLPPVPPVVEWRRVVWAHGKRLDLLPVWMRTLERPRDGSY